MTLSRGDGLLGMRPQGKMGPRGDAVTVAQIDWTYSGTDDHGNGVRWHTPAPTSVLQPRAPREQVSEDGRLRIERDPAAERDAMDRVWTLGLIPLDASHLQWRHPDAAQEFGPLWTLPQEAMFADFWSDTLPALRAEGWDIDVRPGFAHESVAVQRWHLQLDPADGQVLARRVAGDFDPKEEPVQPLGLARREGAWLLSLGIEIEGVRIDLVPLLAHLIARDTRWLSAEHIDSVDDNTMIRLRAPGGRHIDAPAGPLKAILRTMVDLIMDPTRRQRSDGEPISIPDWDVRRIEALRTALLQTGRVAPDNQWQLEGDAGLAQLSARLKRQGVPQPVPVPGGLGITLRNYQIEGLAWLQYLRAQHLGGILADEMGLGKTAQALAHVLIEKQSGRLDHPALVVMPTSLVFNWLAEARHVAPDLRVLELTGPDRARRMLDVQAHDLVITTYPLAWRDVDALAAQAWHLLILDEAQMVKNAGSRTARALRRIRAPHLLCLTGTPLENHLGELWAQFDFLMPGFLGDPHTFGRRWRKPIEENGETLRAQLLAQRVAPFILRRRKSDVAKELPPRTDMTVRVELQGRQRELYEAVRTACDKEVRRVLKAQDWGNAAQIAILDALLKLRQVCCDPRLIKGTSVHPDTERAKLTHLAEMLPELVEEGRRILVFSQFTSMLRLVAEMLDAHGLSYLMLTGRTSPDEREHVVARFQRADGDAPPILLASLKAGGTGLNLTAADTVIHLDPWWNPAVQEQATARAHRIGQTQPVFVYRLVVQGSIEERMLELQERKRVLAQGVLGSDAAGAIKFSPAELAGLLAPLSEPANNPLEIFSADTRRWGGTGRRGRF
ncbi:DEAD/DEAH box helicase [Diaphorobacter ruginosibacter]|uniref:DEAD/DEAH box helicase n=1 Tax=Diaphorobacter ruginosibacter TaxID=1715720 RepID=A0A7G9RUG2_9BURK|nr:DEAD/DEAH box helicase [Diaphorobacter ruginosibacter]QNN59237.1 DEAD/DEAH box helicase [Diaphorobacter ruginosibacter]